MPDNKKSAVTQLRHQRRRRNHEVARSRNRRRLHDKARQRRPHLAQHTDPNVDLAVASRTQPSDDPAADESRPPELRAYLDDDLAVEDEPIDVDLFAGGGGASLGKRMATGRSPTIAVNHSAVAIAMHRENHPETEHYIEDVFAVDPRKAARGRRVRLLWMSPTCTHFSRAKGAALKDRKIRGLAWSIMPWIVHTRPDTIVLENVVEFLGWGPLHRQHALDCAGDSEGNGCTKQCRYGYPIKERAGQTFHAWRKKIESKGYSFEYRKIVAWEHGSPTTRERLYIIMHADGGPAVWPAPTFAREPSPSRPNRWRTAADVIDWEVACPSIFDRPKAHVAATRARLARGVRKFVLESPRPFLLSVKSWGGGGNEPRSIDLPMRTVTASDRGEFAVATPYMIHRSNGERPGQAPRIYDVEAPHPTVVAEGQKTAACVAFLAKHYSERRPGETMGSSLEEPIRTITAQDHHALVAASLIKFGQDATTPLDTVPAGGDKHSVSAAFLTHYNGQSIGQDPANPIGTIDTRDRYGAVQAKFAADWTPEVAFKARRVYRFMLEHGHDGPWMDHDHEIVVVTAHGVQLVIFDLGMRMLTPRELFRAQGFPDSYIIDPFGPRGKRLNKTEQIRAVGNSVCPQVAEAIVRSILARKPRNQNDVGNRVRRAA